MRHQKTRHKLSRTASHRKALLAQPLQGGHRARAHQDHRGEGQGRQARDRAADHARQARRPARPPAGAVGARPGQVRRPQAVRGGRAALRGPPGRLHPHPQARPAPVGLDRDGLPRAVLSVAARRCDALPTAPRVAHPILAQALGDVTRDLTLDRVRRLGVRRLGAAAGAADGPGGARGGAGDDPAARRSPLTVAGRTDRGRPCARAGRLVRRAVGRALRRSTRCCRPTSRCSRAQRRRTASTRAGTRSSRTYRYRVLATPRALGVRARAARCGGRAALDRDAAARLRGSCCRARTTSRPSRRPRPTTSASSATSSPRAGSRTATSLAFEIEADTFMRHMNRVLVGTMLAGRERAARARGLRGAARRRPPPRGRRRPRRRTACTWRACGYGRP